MNGKLVLNSEFYILSKHGQWFAGKLNGQQGPIALKLTDVVLLSLYSELNGASNSVDTIKLQPILECTGFKLSEDQIIERINFFRAHGLLIDSSHISVNNENKILEVPAITESEQNSNIEYTLSSNFAFCISQNRICALSPSINQFIALTSDEVLVILAVNSKEVNETVKQYIKNDKEHQYHSLLMQKLISYNLLVPKARLKPLTSLTKKSKTYAINTEPKKDWQNLEVTNKCPVYFVAHMENHYPLALGMLYAAIERFQNGLLLKYFELVSITYLEPNELLNGPYKKLGCGVWLFSNYMWSEELNLTLSNIIKKNNKDNIMIHGGPSTPDYPESSKQFMLENRSIDISVHGEGENTVVEILLALLKEFKGESNRDECLNSVEGITFRTEFEQLIRTKPRNREKELEIFPSPYLSGAFDNYKGKVEAAIIETNRGCPFGCTFCDWGSATNQKIKKFDIRRTFQEIEWIGRHKVGVLWIADANFGIFNRDILIAEKIVNTKAKYGYPNEVVVNYTKNTNWRLAEIIKIFTSGGIISQGIISIQTTDEKTLNVINRKNIKTKKYDELTKIFDDLSLPLSTDLMIGLPGMTVESFSNDLQKYINLDVAVKAYPTQLLPNSPMADPEYIEKYEIQVDKNNYLISSYSYTNDDLNIMKQLYDIYTMAEGYSLLRYVTRFLQWEYNIKAIDFLNEIRLVVKNQPEKYPHIVWAVRFFLTDKSMPAGWGMFYENIKQFCIDKYNVKDNSAFNTVLTVNKISMPEQALEYPLTVELKHDFTSYFIERKHNNKNSKALKDYIPAEFSVYDPNKVIASDYDRIQYDSHQYFWELQSSTARHTFIESEQKIAS